MNAQRLNRIGDETKNTVKSHERQGQQKQHEKITRKI